MGLLLCKRSLWSCTLYGLKKNGEQVFVLNILLYKERHRQTIESKSDLAIFPLLRKKIPNTHNLKEQRFILARNFIPWEAVETRWQEKMAEDNSVQPGKPQNKIDRSQKQQESQFESLAAQSPV